MAIQLAPALRLAIQSRFVKSGRAPESDGARDARVSASVLTAVLAIRPVLLSGDLEMVAPGYVNRLPVSALKALLSRSR